jgi:hypothetical protein
MIRGIKRRPILVIAGLALAFGGIAPVGVGATTAVPFRG